MQEERREHKREQLKMLSGNFINEMDQIISFSPIDISENGLGLLMKPAPLPGQKLTFQYGLKHLTFTVQWVREENDISVLLGMQELKRCGLKLEEDTVNLVHLLG